MGKIKGWMIHQTLKSRKTWVHVHQNPFREVYVGIEQLSDGKWSAFNIPLLDKGGNRIRAYKNSKASAREIAINYMRSHPNG